MLTDGLLMCKSCSMMFQIMMNLITYLILRKIITIIINIIIIIQSKQIFFFFFYDVVGGGYTLDTAEQT